MEASPENHPAQLAITARQSTSVTTSETAVCFAGITQAISFQLHIAVIII
jgi:hypothetical protein